MSDWRTIDSAPPDKMVLVYVGWLNEIKPAILHSGQRHRSKPGWQICFSGSYKSYVHGVPSHWMSFPEPPGTPEPQSSLPSESYAILERAAQRTRQIEEIGKLFLAGKTYDQLAPQFSMNRNQIAGIIKRLGLRRTIAVLPE